jgi:hypothetical protein
MSTYDLALLDANGNRLRLPTNRAEGVTISTGPRGFQDAQAFIPLTDAQADQLVQTPGLRMKLSDGGGVIWEGRVEDIALRNGGVQLGGLGDARLLDDIAYTALWSDASVAGWIQNPDAYTFTLGDASMRFEADTNNRLYLTPEKNATFVQFDGFIFNYDIPDQSLRTIAAISFDYEIFGPLNWTFAVRNKNGNTFLSDTTGFGTSGVLQTGTVNTTQPANTTRINIMFFWADAVATTVAGETGSIYVRITNIRVKSTTSATLYADEVIKAVRDQTNVVNPGALSTSNRLIISPTIDLMQAIYEDTAPSAILDELASFGNSAGLQYEWGVFEGRELFFRTVGSAARQWAIDAADLDIEQSLDGLYNSTYGLYQDANGRTLRTAAQTNAQSIGRYGLTRQTSQDADTTSSATATTIAATATAATATPIPRATVKVRRFSTLTGAPARGEWVRSGDTVTIRNLPPTTNTAVDRVRTFTVAQTSFNLDTGEVTVIPESPGPDLEFQIAQLLAR